MALQLAFPYRDPGCKVMLCVAKPHDQAYVEKVVVLILRRSSGYGWPEEESGE